MHLGIWCKRVTFWIQTCQNSWDGGPNKWCFEAGMNMTQLLEQQSILWHRVYDSGQWKQTTKQAKHMKNNYMKYISKHTGNNKINNKHTLILCGNTTTYSEERFHQIVFWHCWSFFTNSPQLFLENCECVFSIKFNMFIDNAVCNFTSILKFYICSLLASFH